MITFVTYSKTAVMKKIQLLLAFLCFISISCSSNDDNDATANQTTASRNTVRQPVDNSEYIYYKIGNGPTVFITDDMYAEVNAVGFKLSGRGTLANGLMDVMIIEGHVFTLGTYTLSQFDLIGSQDVAYGSTNNTMQFNVTHIGTVVGDYIDVAFSGTYYSTVPGKTKSITGFAHIRRDY